MAVRNVLLVLADPESGGRLAASRERMLDALLANKLRGPEQISHA